MIASLLGHPVRFSRMLQVGLLSFVLAGCGDSADPCTPGRALECACADGRAGTQVCADDGSEFTSCECGVEVDGGADANMSDSAADADQADVDLEDATRDAVEPDSNVEDVGASDTGSSDASSSDASSSDASSFDAGSSDAMDAEPGDAESDGSVDAEMDAEGDAAAPMTMTHEVPPGVGGHEELARVGDEVDSVDSTRIDEAGAMAADFSCLGSRVPPPGGPTAEVTLTLRDFQSDSPVEGVCVEVYPDNVPERDNRCEGSVTNEEGEIVATVPTRGEIAYRAFVDGRQYINTVGTNIRTPLRGEGLTIEVVSSSTRMLIPTVLGTPVAADTDMIIGRVSDCSGRSVYGVEVRVFDTDGDLVVEPEDRASSDPFYRYFNGAGFPNGGQRFSHIDGLFIAGNLPAGDHTLEIWGRRRRGGPLELLACESVQTLPNGVSVVSVNPRGRGARCASRRLE